MNQCTCKNQLKCKINFKKIIKLEKKTTKPLTLHTFFDAVELNAWLVGAVGSDLLVGFIVVSVNGERMCAKYLGRPDSSVGSAFGF